jgi:hypothetical protein
VEPKAAVINAKAPDVKVEVVSALQTGEKDKWGFMPHVHHRCVAALHPAVGCSFSRPSDRVNVVLSHSQLVQASQPPLVRLGLSSRLRRI